MVSLFMAHKKNGDNLNVIRFVKLWSIHIKEEYVLIKNGSGRDVFEIESCSPFTTEWKGQAIEFHFLLRRVYL